MPVNKSKRSEIILVLSSLPQSVLLFRKNDPLRMAGATAFFTTFALPPIIFILAQLFGLFIDRRKIGQGLLQNISDTLGRDGAEQVRQVIRSIRGFSDNWFVLVPGFIFLVFVATTLFNVIKNSLDQIWKIGIKERPGLVFILGNRLRSFAIIMVAGILFLASLVFESLKIITADYFEDIWEGSGIFLRSFIGNIASVIIVATWFIVLFRFLADAKPSWKASILGGLLASILFIAGRLLLRFLLVNSNLGYLYGASGSFVLVLLFVFYSSFILYYCACFIAVYSEKKGWPIEPKSHAYSYRIEEVKK